MIVIVDHATLKDEEGNKETIVKTAAIQQDIKELLRCGLWRLFKRFLTRRTRQHSWDNQ